MKILVIFTALFILLILTLKKVPIIVSSLICVLFMAVFSGMPVFDTIGEEYMGGLAGFVKSTWLMLLLGTILSRLMDNTGAAASIARSVVGKLGEKWAIPAIIICGGLLTYGGISSFVACYALYPIALVVFREAKLPKYLIPGVIGAGIHSWGNMLPGNPSVLNIIPGTYLGTTAMAAPGIGILAAAATLALTLLYFKYEVKKAGEKDGGFEIDSPKEKKGLPNPFLSLLPIVCVVIVMNVFKQDVSVALLAGVLLSCLLFCRFIRGFREILLSASGEAASTMITAASVVGIGNVLRVTPGFQDIADLILRFGGSGRNPLVIFALAVALMSGLNASAVSGLSTILSALADPFLKMGISAEILHRVGVIAAIGPGGLPHSGGMVAILEISGISYREGYKHLFAAVAVIPLMVLILLLVFGNMLYPSLM